MLVVPAVVLPAPEREFESASPALSPNRSCFQLPPSGRCECVSTSCQDTGLQRRGVLRTSAAGSAWRDNGGLSSGPRIRSGCGSTEREIVQMGRLTLYGVARVPPLTRREVFASAGEFSLRTAPRVRSRREGIADAVSLDLVVTRV